MKFEIVYYNHGEILKFTHETDSEDHTNILSSYSLKTKEIKEYYNLWEGFEITEQYFDEYPQLELFSKSINGCYKKYFITEQCSNLTRTCDDILDIYKVDGVSLESFDICPDIEFVICMAVTYLPSGEEYEKEIFFDVTSAESMRKISEYYNLPFPLEEDNDFDQSPFIWNTHWWEAHTQLTNFNLEHKYNTLFRTGSIKFKNRIPNIFKMYRQQDYLEEGFEKYIK